MTVSLYGYLLARNSLVVMFTVIFVFELPCSSPLYTAQVTFSQNTMSTLELVITTVHYLDVCNILRLLKLA